MALFIRIKIVHSKYKSMKFSFKSLFSFKTEEEAEESAARFELAETRKLARAQADYKSKRDQQIADEKERQADRDKRSQ